ncbi:MAG TPA: RNA polymerase factor sigma-54 [Burkholderiales bacterium]|nr:RNA polymerase factor sigma-54 [Burkholderiales bacterium]
MAPALDLRLRQHLALTPQLQQALRLLQLSALEFAQEMGEALVNNPFLEEQAEKPQHAATSASSSTLSEPATPTTAAPESAAPDNEGEERYSYESPSFGSGGSGDMENDRTDWSEPEPSLQAHLRNQLMLSPMGERDRALAHLIVDALDDDGYLKVSLEELAALLTADGGVEPDELRASLKLVQTLEPAGVGARDLQECLTLQLNARDERGPAWECACRIVQNHLPVLAAHELGKLQQQLNCDEKTMHQAIALIRSLDPKPGHRFGRGDARFVIPDVIVTKVRGKWVCNLNPAVVPRLRINRSYADAVSGAGHSFLSKQLQEARWLLRSMEQRLVTIQRVAEAIVQKQRAFLEYGEVAMKPLALKHIAAQLNLHESTVCRVTNNKYMATPRGVYEFKHFFSRQLATEAGGACSATAVRALLKELITTEDPARPLSDAKLATLLSEQGLRVARRTITKYRTLMRVPSVEVRRTLGRSQTMRAQA